MKDYILIVGQPSKDALICWLEKTFGIIIKNAQDLANNEILNYSNIKINIKFLISTHFHLMLMNLNLFAPK